MPTPGHVLDEQVALGEEADHRHLDRLPLAVHDLGDVRRDGVEQRRRTASSSASEVGSSPPAWRLGSDRHAARVDGSARIGRVAVSASVAGDGGVTVATVAMRYLAIDVGTTAGRRRRRREPARSSSATGSPRRRATCGRRCTASCAASSPPAPTTPTRWGAAASAARARSTRSGTVSPLHIPTWQGFELRERVARADRAADRARHDGPGAGCSPSVERRRPGRRRLDGAADVRRRRGRRHQQRAAAPGPAGQRRPPRPRRRRARRPAVRRAAGSAA